MFAGAGANGVLCLGLIYLVTVTGDTSYEIIIYMLVLLGFILVARGYYLEEKYKRSTHWSSSRSSPTLSFYSAPP